MREKKEIRPRKDISRKTHRGGGKEKNKLRRRKSGVPRKLETGGKRARHLKAPKWIRAFTC